MKNLLTILISILLISNYTQAQTQLGTKIIGDANYDQAGRSIALSANGLRMAVGSPFNSGGGSLRGQVKVYDWTGTAWVQMGLALKGEANDDESGLALSLSSDGNILAIGAPENAGGGSARGQVRVYIWNGSSWNQRGTDIDGESNIDQSGWSISLSSDGNKLAIGAILNNGGGSERGHVRIYAWNGSSWVQQGADIDGEANTDQSGRSVSLSSDGNIVAIGSPYNDNGGTDKGQVRIFTWNGTAWLQRGSNISGDNAGDNFGYSVSLSKDGNKVAIGAIYNSTTGYERGQVKIMKWNGGSWVQMGSSIYGEGNGDNSGWSVSLASDTTRVVIGSYKNVSSGLSKGHARIFSWTGSSWFQECNDLDGEYCPDYYGYAVAISTNGNIIAVGAPRYSYEGSDKGEVMVYTPCNANVLPVSLLNFSAELKGVYAELKWSTAAELNCNYFEVEQSFDGSKFNKIGEVNSNGTSTNINEYSLKDIIHLPIANATVYYRLKIVDLNGEYSFSHIVALDLSSIDKNSEILIGPNPFHNIISISVVDSKYENSVIKLYSIIGSEVKNLEIYSLKNGTMNLETSKLPSGIYTLIISTYERTISYKLMKN